MAKSTKNKVTLRDGPAVVYMAAIIRIGKGALVEEVQKELTRRHVAVEIPSIRVALQRLRKRQLITAKAVSGDLTNRVRYSVTREGKALLKRWQKLIS